MTKRSTAAAVVASIVAVAAGVSVYASEQAPLDGSASVENSVVTEPQPEPEPDPEPVPVFLPASEPAPIEDGSVAYRNDFSTQGDAERIDQFVAYRDPFVVNHTVGVSDHAPMDGSNCTAPEETRPQTRESPAEHVYHCFPGGNAEAGHQMAFAMDSSGYGFVGALPDQVFEGVSEVSVDINTTSAGRRNFIEIKVVPADNVFVNAMPCIPDLPCNSGWDYSDTEGVGAGTDSLNGTGLKIATPAQPDGYVFDRDNEVELPNGDRRFEPCNANAICFRTHVHDGNTGIRDRYQHVFRDNGDGTLSFGIERDDGAFDWVEAPGAFPDGPVRVIVAFHNYTGTKDDNGPGFESNLSPSAGGFTWHWDDLTVMADATTPSLEYFGGVSADRIVTPPGCIAFAQGQRTVTHGKDVLPLLHCEGDAPLDL